MFREGEQVPDPARPVFGLVGWRRGSRARHKVVKRDSKAAVRCDAALRQVSGHGVSSGRGQVAGGPSSGVVIAGHGEAGQCHVVRVREALGALVLRVARSVAVVTRVGGGDDEGRGAADNGLCRGDAETRAARNAGRTSGLGLGSEAGRRGRDSGKRRGREPVRRRRVFAGEVECVNTDARGAEAEAAGVIQGREGEGCGRALWSCRARRDARCRRR